MFKYTKIKSNTLMFHNFHDNVNFLYTPGSLSTSTFENLIKSLKLKKYSILKPAEFFSKLLKKKLNKKEILLTFDDGLKCQIKLVLPILKRYKLEGIFFIPTYKFFKSNSFLEAKRYFMYTYFKNIENFYEIYFKLYFINLNNRKKFFKKNFNSISNFKKKYPFYNTNDVAFRFIRANNIKKHNLILKKIMKKFNYSEDKKSKKLLMNSQDYKKLIISKQCLGLHSDEHFSSKKNLTHKKELQNYLLNFKILSKYDKNILSASYPTNIYTKNSQKILKNVGIKYSFISNDKNKSKFTKYKIPRTDITYLIKK